MRSEAAIGEEVRYRGKYLSASFRRDGTGVATPVWFVQREGRLLVETDAGSYKVERIRRNPKVTVAPCTATGRLRGEPVSGYAELLAEAEIPNVEWLLARKYRVELLFIRSVRWLQRVVGGQRRTPALLAVRLR